MNLGKRLIRWCRLAWILFGLLARGRCAPGVSRGTIVLDFPETDLFFRYQVTLGLIFGMSGWDVVWILHPRCLARSWEFWNNHDWLT